MTTPPFDPHAAKLQSASDMQRGACPALSAPMMTGDGLLARIALTDAISPAELATLCYLARRHGNGMLDISARGNLQVRGLTDASAPLLDADVRALNLPLRDGLAVEVPPFAGLDKTEIADPRPLADAIRQGARDITGLAPKMSIIVDGNGRLRLSDLLADIRLVAVCIEDEVFWEIRLGGGPESGGVFNVLRETLAVEETLSLLKELAARGNKERGRDLVSELVEAGQSAPISALAGRAIAYGMVSVRPVAAPPSPQRGAGGRDEAVDSSPVVPSECEAMRGPHDKTLSRQSSAEPPRPPAGTFSPPGRRGNAAPPHISYAVALSPAGENGSLPQHLAIADTRIATSPFDVFDLTADLYATGIGPAFGQVTAENLITLCDEATRLEIASLKPALDHSLIFFGTLEACQALTAFAAANGFIISGSDPRGHIAACSGKPACASANITTHEIAARAATECGDLLDGSFKLHVAGCPKGCAHPQVSALTLCGTAAGLSVIHKGKASDPPFATAAFADTNATLRRLADLVRSERRAGENSATCLARLGSERLAATVMSGRS